MWERRVTALLCEAKAAGLSFAAARDLAERKHPARQRGQEGVLFVLDDPKDPPEKPVEECFWEYAEDAWYGRKPALRGWSLDLLDRTDEGGSFASAHGRLNAAHSAAA